MFNLYIKGIFIVKLIKKPKIFNIIKIVKKTSKKDNIVIIKFATTVAIVFSISRVWLSEEMFLILNFLNRLEKADYQ